MKLFRAFGALALLLLPIHLADRMSDVHAAPATRGAELARVMRGTISRNATLGSLLDKTLSPASVDAIVRAAKPVYDLARLSVGRPFALGLGPDGLALVFTYGIDELRTLRVQRNGDEWKADLVTRDYERTTVSVAGVIRSSLFAAVNDIGEDDQLALDLADIFAWDVDFNTEIQRGDNFRVAVEKLQVDGRFVKYGRILAAEMVRGTRTLQAVRFDAARGGGYYAPDGTPLRKAFLRSPLRFSRISSGYSAARFHPILSRMTAHRGIDYAAPAGTPVNASADGVVALAGWMDGFGNTVRLRHANGFETLYGHLSRIDVRAGQRVSQGTPIGAVGMTGLATGPHLHYAMFRAGAYANPMTIQLPPAEPIGPEEETPFLAARAVGLRLLGAAPHAPAAAVADASVPKTPPFNRRP